ncbi:LIM zinc-binding domain-containing Nebulette-like isoform X1 [Scyliorhinus torazame]|uniref:LIM zinc-binding domain-containing Nebulette-like isoform X1 n=1 Tax=Scyliorhinus torazame TaxID=75743 RepID=UPI003B58D4B6
MNPQCARCGKIVYPTEKVNCLDKYWHKACFHCEICRMTLNMKTYKGYEKKPYCNAHYPKQQFTIVADTPENLRLKQQSELQSQAKYKEDFERNRGRGFSIVTDTPELQRLKRTQEQISNIKYHEDFERTRGKGFTSVSDDLVTERARKNTQFVSDAMYKGVHPHVVEMEKSRSGIMGEFKVWRTDPGSIFDFDPLEDNIQSRSLHLLSEKAKLCSKQSQSTGVGSISVGDEKSEMTELNTSISSYSEQTMEFSGEREKAKRCSKQSQSAGVGSISVGDEKSEMTELNTSISSHSEHTMEFSGERAAVLPGAYQQMHSPHSPGYGYMHQSSVSSMRPQHSLPHTINMRTYRAMYDYTAADEDEVSFKDGDYIINVQAIDEGWMYGTVQRTGKTGMLPANYVEPLH